MRRRRNEGVGEDTSRQEGEERGESALRRRRDCASRKRGHKSLAGAKIIEDGSPRGRLNPAAASSVCWVIVGRADQVVSEEKQAGMWAQANRGGEGKGREGEGMGGGEGTGREAVA